MKILNSEQVREADAYTIANEPIASIDLMERAAVHLTNRILDRINNNCTFRIFAGPGNNGGDGLAIARMLTEDDFEVFLYVIRFSDKFSEDFCSNYVILKEQTTVNIVEITDKKQLPDIDYDDILIDALFGSGLSRPLEGLPADVALHMNKSGAYIIAIDSPSGLFSENNGENSGENKSENIVCADHTFTLQFPKLSFLFPENEKYVGSWEVVPIGLHPEFIENVETNHFLIKSEDVADLLPHRKTFSHKGNFGHALLISGSYGKMGAAVLSSKACLRSGVGLLTIHIPQIGYNILQTAVPEAMVSVDNNMEIFANMPDLIAYNVIGVGPGIGMDKNTKQALHKLLLEVNVPLVLDADAINILGENKDWLKLLPEGSILTPHPKEFERLVGKFENPYLRNQAQLEFAKKYKVVLILKGAFTAIATPDGKCWFNSSGNPGMATAGSGDVLTGIILSLLAQGFSSQNAAIAGVYIHGLAGDIAVETGSEEALIASDIIDNIGNAFNHLRNQEFES